MNRSVLLILAVIASASATFDDRTFETCLRKDSISCLQIHVYKKLKAILSLDSIDLLGGFRLVRNRTSEDESNVGGDILKVNEVVERQAMLEDFIYEKLKGFFRDRSLEWNVSAAVEQIAPTAKKVMESIPQNVRERMVTLFNEGRGKKKKWFFPMIIAVKTTFFTWVKVVFVGVAFLAKKALVMSIIALTIAMFLAFKKHSTKEYGETYHTAVPYYAPPVNWQPIQHPAYDSYDLHSSPSHHLAYSSQKPGLR